MLISPLPAAVQDLCSSLDVPPRLVAHLRLVYDVALQLTAALDKQWPSLGYDRAAVLIGAATHDIGKVVQRNELSAPGQQHGIIGEEMLLAAGFSPAQARFARTHARWADQEPPQLEDMLVALADKIWRGRRDEALEAALNALLSAAALAPPWRSYMQLDAILGALAARADERLAWQNTHPL